MWSPALQVLLPPAVSMVPKPAAPKKEALLPLRPREAEDAGSGGPTTTVFVGNISEKASDMLVRQLLAVSLADPVTPSSPLAPAQPPALGRVGSAPCYEPSAHLDEKIIG